jgi:hypothetical protein
VSILHAHIKWIVALLSQLAQTFVAVAGGRATTVEPNAVQLIPGDKLPDEFEFALHELLPADTELPQVRPIPFVFRGRPGRLGVLGAARGVGLYGIGERLLPVGDLLST